MIGFGQMGWQIDAVVKCSELEQTGAPELVVCMTKRSQIGSQFALHDSHHFSLGICSAIPKHDSWPGTGRLAIVTAIPTAPAFVFDSYSHPSPLTFSAVQADATGNGTEMQPLAIMQGPPHALHAFGIGLGSTGSSSCLSIASCRSEMAVYCPPRPTHLNRFRSRRKGWQGYPVHLG